MSDPFFSSRNDPLYTSTSVTLVPRWVVALALTLALVLGFGLFLISATFVMIMTPVVVLSGLFIRWRLRRALREAAASRRTDFIEAEYHIIDPKQDR